MLVFGVVLGAAADVAGRVGNVEEDCNVELYLEVEKEEDWGKVTLCVVGAVGVVGKSSKLAS